MIVIIKSNGLLLIVSSSSSRVDLGQRTRSQVDASLPGSVGLPLFIVHVIDYMFMGWQRRHTVETSLL